MATWDWGLGALRRRFWEKGEAALGLEGWAWSTGGGVGVGVLSMLSMARAGCGVREEKSKAAKVAWEVADLNSCESGLELKMFLVAKSFRWEKKGRGIGRGDLDLEVVLGVGGEWRIVVVPKKLEESKGLVAEAIAGVCFLGLSLSPPLPLVFCYLLDKNSAISFEITKFYFCLFFFRY